MAGGYLIDPATGQPAVQTASGALLPLPMSHDDLIAAGLQGPPGLPPPPDKGPDERLAYNGGGALFGVPGIAPPSSNSLPTEPIKQAIGWRDPATVGAAPGSPRAAEIAASAPPPAASPPPRADPSELARPGQGGGQAQSGQGGTAGLDPLEQLAYEQALQGGGGGGPRRLGVTGQTEKYTTTQNPVDPRLAAQAQEALGASDAYSEQLAISLRDRQQQGYAAQQAEFAQRSGQLAAQQQRFEQKQLALQDYEAKRDAAMQEAAQLKTPQMEDYWGSRGTFANVMTGLSIALGGELQGLRGGQNPGLEMSNQSIDRWIAGQREEYQRADGRVNAMDNQYARMVQRFGSENLATDHLREQAWAVRDGMLRSYAEKIGTPDALENFNQAMLQTEAQRAALRAQNSRGAAVEIEQKLSMQGGGGAARPKVKDAVHDAALVHKDLADLRGDGNEPGRAIESGKTETITGAINSIDAADEIEKHVKNLGYADSDTDDPLSGPVDYVTKNIPGTQTKHTAQDLERATQNFARGLQQSLGKSDNDAKLADQMAAGGGSGRQRLQAAQTGKKRATALIQDTLAGMTPDQKRAFIKALPEDRRQRVLQIVGSSAGFAPASSERAF